MNEDGGFEYSTNISHLYSLSQKDFREENEGYLKKTQRNYGMDSL